MNSDQDDLTWGDDDPEKFDFFEIEYEISDEEIMEDLGEPIGWKEWEEGLDD